MPWTVVARNVLESMVSQEREREVERDTEIKTDREEQGRPWQGEKEREGKRHREGWREERERGRSEPAAASQSIKSPEWEEGVRERLASAQAQPWLRAE